MMARQLRWRSEAQQVLRRLLMGCCLCFSSWLHAALTVQVMGAPEPAVRALRSAAPDILWTTEPVAGQPVQLTLLWQAGGEDGKVSASRMDPRPRLVLAQSPGDWDLRSGDSALYWGVDLVSQWRLASDLVPGAQRVGVFYRQAQAADVEALRRDVGEERLVARVLTRPPSARDVAELAQRVDVMLGIRDSTLFSRETAKVILLSAYRHQRPWIGPTPAFVTAGAVATRAVPKSALIDAIVSQLRHWERVGEFQPPRTLEPSDVVCNAQVARSLGVAISRVPCSPVRSGS